MDLNWADRATRTSAVFALIIGGLAVGIGVLAYFFEFSGAFASRDHPVIAIYGPVLAGIAYFLRRHSRTAALLFLAFYLEQTFDALGTIGLASPQVVVAIPIRLIFLYYIGRGVLGAFLYHRLRRKADPHYRPAPIWAYVVGSPILTVFAVLATLGAASSLGYIAPTDVLRGEEMRGRHVSQLKSLQLLEQDEEIVLFYSAAFWSVLEDGNILTDRRVISYWVENKEFKYAATLYADISDVSVAEQGDLISDTIILIRTNDESEIYIYASATEDGDQVFLDELIRRWHSAVGQDHVAGL